MEEVFGFMKQIVSVVGTVEMIKNFDKQKKVPGFVWVIITVILGTLSVLPFVPEWILDAALVVSVSTLFYDVILQNIKKTFAKKFGGTDE
jgi:low affinity Fe/Cu permease